MAFLSFIFAATYWHIDLMNWIPLNLATIVWMIAYTAEPLTVPFVEPSGAEFKSSVPKAQERDAISSAMQNALLVVMWVAVALGAMLFINPLKFIANLWPWPSTALDARIMSSFFAGIVFWAAKMKLAQEWSEIRLGGSGADPVLRWTFPGMAGQPFHRAVQSRNKPVGVCHRNRCSGDCSCDPLFSA